MAAPSSGAEPKVLLHYLAIIKNSEEPVHELCAEKNLTSVGFFKKSLFAEVLTFSGKEIAQRTKPGQRRMITQNEKLVHAQCSKEGICAIAITEEGYNQVAGQMLLLRVLDEFTAAHPASMWAKENPTIDWPKLKELLQWGQDPTKVNPMGGMQDDIDATKEILKDTINGVLERGEKLDDLVNKSNDLSAASKMFLKQAKKTNSCCVLM